MDKQQSNLRPNNANFQVEQAVLNNSGFLAGIVHGNVHVNYYHLPQEVLGGITATEGARPELGENPYKDLQSFELKDYKRFFGRRRETSLLWNRLKQLCNEPKAIRVLPVYGPSGSGKSSLIRAGLLPALLKQPPSGGDSLQAVGLLPGRYPLHSLVGKLVRLLPSAYVGQESSLVAQLVRPNTQGEYDGLHKLVSTMPELSAVPLVVLVDQFEEIFTLCDNAKEQRAFIENLLFVAASPTQQVSVILTLRSDFLGQTQDFPMLNQLCAQQGRLVPGLTEGELRDVISLPAKQAGYSFDISTVERLVEQTKRRSGALPLLQFALTRLWEACQKDTDPAETLVAIGGVGGALANKAHEIYDCCNDLEKTIARRVFLGLIHLGEGAQDTRRRVSLDSLVAHHEDTAQVRSVIARFASREARLITVSSDGVGGQETVEVTHEALIDHWQVLRQWLDEGRDDLRFQRRLDDSARYWDIQKRPVGLLWRRPDLDLLRNYHQRSRHQMTMLQLSFFKAAIRQERQQRFQWSTGIFVLIILTAGMTWFGVKSRRAEQYALGRQLAAQAEQLINQLGITQQEVGALIAVHASESVKITGKELGEVNQALRHSFSKLPLNTFKHKDQVRNIIFSPDGQRVATASLDGTAKVWDATTGDIMATLNHEGGVSTVAFSPNAKQILTSSAGGIVKVWDANTWTTVTTLNHEGGIRSAIFSPDSQQVTTAGDAGTARVWDATTGDIRANFNHDDWVFDVEFSPDNQQVATATRDGKAQIWDIKSGNPIAAFIHNGAIWEVTFSPDGYRVVTAGFDRRANIWDALTGENIATLNHDDNVIAVAFSPDGQQVATASDDGTAKIWDATTGISISILSHDNNVRAIAFSPDGQQVATASDDGTARIWQAINRQAISNFDHGNEVLNVTFSPNGQKVASASRDGTARLWDAFHGDNLFIFNHDDQVIDVTFSPNGQQVATASLDGTAKVWDATTGDILATLSHEYGVSTVTFSPNGQWVATASEGAAKIWNATTGNILATLNHDGLVRDVIFSPNGQWVGTASNDGTARVWDATTGNIFAVLNHDEGVWDLTFSLDSQRIVTASFDRTAQVWDFTNGSILSTLSHDGGVIAVAFSPDNKRVATASGDGTARVWSTTNGSTLTILNHDDWVRDVTFSPNGQQIATASKDGTAKVWDIQTGDVLATFKHDAEIWAVAFSPDGQRIATASSDGTVKVHWLYSGALAELICQRLTRNFSAFEWTNYVQADLSRYTLTCPNLPVHPTVLEAAHAQAKAGNVNKATTLLRRLLRISQAAGHDIDLDPATEAQAQDPRVVALKYSAVHWVREATALARAGDIPKAISLFEKALSYDPEIDLNSATEDLEQDPQAVAQSLANATSDD